MTPAGWRAKALVALTHSPELLAPHDFTGEAVTSLLLDLAGDYDPIAVAEGKFLPAEIGSTVPRPDVELLGLCQRYEAAMHGWRAIINAGEPSIEGDVAAAVKADPLWQEMRALLPALTANGANTSDGLAARARLLHVVNGVRACSWSSEDGNRAGLMLDALLRDAGALVIPPSDLPGGTSPTPGAAA